MALASLTEGDTTVSARLHDCKSATMVARIDNWLVVSGSLPWATNVLDGGRPLLQRDELLIVDHSQIG